MRNLILLGERHSPLPTPGKLVTFCYDGGSDAFFMADSSGIIMRFSDGKDDPDWECSLQEKKLLPAGKQWTYVGFQFVPELESLCVALSSGELLLVAASPVTAPSMVGIVDAGIHAARWSPDMELLVLITGNRTMVLMTKQFDVVTEKDLPHAKATAAVAKESSLAECVSWRGDGQYFVSNTLTSAGKWLLHVWDRKGELHSTAESVPSLSPLVHWRPAGPLFASTAPTGPSGSQQVLFFERNGLRHGEFNVRRNWHVQAIEWNSASDVLALLLFDTAAQRFYVQLWTTSNYHWYLKHEFEFVSRVASMQWDGENGGRLRVLTEDGTLSVYDVCFDYIVSAGNDSSNPATVAVIDGEVIHLTDLRDSIVPPPMAQRRVDVGARALRHVSLASTASSRWLLAAARSSGEIALMPARAAGVVQSRVALTTEKVGWVTLAGADAQISARQLVLVADDSVLALVHNKGSDHVLELVFSHVANELTASVTQHWRTSAAGGVVRLVHNPDTHTTVLHLADGRMFKYIPGRENAAGASLQPWTMLEPLKVVCPFVHTAVIGGQERVVSLSDRAKLYVDGTLISAEATSFATEQNFILFTTFSHHLRLLRLSIPFSSTWAEQKTAVAGKQFDELARAVERGSRIVCAVPHDTKVVLQMPRGNLEAVFPRARVLTSARELLDSNRYRDAFLLLRQQRVDLNIIHDHAPARFVSSLKTIVQQIADVDYLNLLISSLSDDDVTATMYPDPAVPGNLSKPKTIAGKINSVCDALRSTFQELDSKKYLLCILTTYVKKNPPALEEALSLVKQLRDAEHADVVHLVGVETKQQGQHSLKAESALKYLIFLADVNQLYDIALGMYDFELVMMVAQKSQKDPKEYVPFLESLQQLPTHIQRYTIDKHLKRYAKALAHLSEAGDDQLDTALALIKEHKLHALAEQLYRKKSPKAYHAVLEAYGAHLEANTKFEEAALAYRLAGQLPRALEAAKASANWQLLFSIALPLNLDAAEKKALAQEMATKLRETGDAEGAAAVLLRFTGDATQAVLALCNGGLFLNAALTSLEHNLPLGAVETAVRESAEHTKSELDGKIKEFERLLARLRVVRENKRLGAIVAADKAAAGGQREEDAVSQFSDATSAVSRLTTTTVTTISKTTGKPRKKVKQVRKRLTPREGSPYEEEYLLNTLHELLPTDRFYSTVAELLKGLVYVGQFSIAKEIQSAFGKLLALFDESKAELLVPPTPPPIIGGDAQPQQSPNQNPASAPRSPFVAPFLPQRIWRLSTLD